LPDGLFSNPKTHRGKWKMLVYFMAILSISLPFGIFYGYLVHFMVIWYILLLSGIFYGYLVYFMVIWYILWLSGILYGYLVYFSRSGRLYQEKSGNPAVFIELNPVF
jgi:hypothetical protein